MPLFTFSAAISIEQKPRLPAIERSYSSAVRGTSSPRVSTTITACVLKMLANVVPRRNLSGSISPKTTIMRIQMMGSAERCARSV